MELLRPRIALPLKTLTWRAMPSPGNNEKSGESYRLKGSEKRE